MSFKYRFIIAFVTLEIFFIAIIVGINFFTINERSQDYMTQKINTTKTLLSQLIKSPMSVYDLGTLDNIIENTKFIEDVKYIAVIDAQHRMLSTNLDDGFIDFKDYDKFNDVQYVTLNKKEYAFVYENIYNDDVKLGHIHIVFDMTDNTAAIEKNKQSTYVLIFIEILLSTLLAFILGRSLTDKLLNLSSVAMHIGKNISTRVPYKHTSDEIGVLADAMDKMQNQIDSRNEKLHLFAELFANTQESILITDRNGKIIMVNHSFTTLSGYTQKEALGLDPNILKSGKHEESFYKQMWHDVFEKGAWNGEIINQKKNGDYYTAILNINAIKNELGNVTNFVAISTDITTMKERERIMTVQAKMATMGEMLNNIAHQWRQPLSAITTAASGLLIQQEMDLLDDNNLKRSLNTIIKSSQYLSKTIEDFRNYFRQDKELITFFIRDLIENDLTIIEAVLKNMHITLKIDIEEDMKISNYQNELIQALVNIVQNSKDALSEIKGDKVVFIKARRINDTLELLIRDNAGGIKDDIIEKIFEPYFTTKHRAQGTGIGLYMTHTIIIEHMGGEIKVENSEFSYKGKKYKGLDFYIYLPIDIS